MFTAESQAATSVKPYLTSLDPTAVTFRSSEVTITLVHSAVCESKGGSSSSTQQISAEPEPQRVWKEEEELAVVSSLYIYIRKGREFMTLRFSLKSSCTVCQPLVYSVYRILF